MNVTIERKTWRVSFSAEEHGLEFESGRIGSFSVLPSPLFRMKLEGPDGEAREITSAEGWRRVRTVCAGDLDVLIRPVQGALGRVK